MNNVKLVGHLKLNAMVKVTTYVNVEWNKTAPHNRTGGVRCVLLMIVT